MFPFVIRSIYIMKKKLKLLITKLLCFSFLFVFNNSYAEEKKIVQASEYTINYDNVSIIEYIQFVSKICNTNFLYSKDDLNFNITVISKEPISKQSVLSTLIQVLHIHDLYLIEDNDNIIISKVADVKELAPVISQNLEDIKNPIITSIFPIKNTPIETLSSVIKPMISKNALLEILANERQLVITDVTINIKKVASLIENLDAAENPLVIESYNIKANSTGSLITLTKQIMAPLISTNPYILVPQDSTKTIFIVSTPFLAKKTLLILENLDTPYQAEMKTEENLKMFIYKPLYRSQKEIQNSLENLAKNLKKEGYFENVVEAIDNMKWIDDSYSFVFSAPENTISKLQQILKSLDTPIESKEMKEKASLTPSYLLVKLNHVSGEQIEEEFELLTKKFKEQKIEEPKLLEVMENIKWVKETNSILLSGDKESIDEVKNLIAQYDNPENEKKPKTKANFYIYTPKHATLDNVEDYLNNLAKNLQNSGLSDPALLDSITTMKAVPATNSIIFTGNNAALDKIKDLLTKFDQPKEGQLKGNFLMFSPKHSTLDDMQESLNEIANNLKKSGLADPYLLDSIKSMKTVPSTNSLIFTGNEQTLNKVQSLLNTIDQPLSKQAIQKLGKMNFWVYKIQHASAQQLIISIKSIATDLTKLDSSDKNFIKTLTSLRYVKETNSLVFTGTQEALEKVEPLVKNFDVPSDMKGAMQAYFVYTPIYLPGPELEQILQHFAENLKSSNLENPALYEIIDSMKYSDTTKTLVFTGETSAIEEIKQLLASFDIPNSNFPSTREISGLEDLGFLVYKIQYHKGNEIQDALKQIASDLKTAQGEAANKFKLIKSIEAIQWIKVTNSLLCSGDKETLVKLKELINNLDVPLKQVFIEVLVIQTTLSNALNFGLEWATKFQYKDKAVMGVSNAAPSTNGTSPFITTMNGISNTTTPSGSSLLFGDGFDLGIIGDILFHKGKSFLSLGSLLSALQTDTETSIVMTPKIIAQDGKTARIFSGSNIPYTGSVITNNGAATVTTTNLEYRDVGLDLTITPILGNSDSVTLTINLESSATPSSGTSTVALGNVTGITTYKTNMNTAVHIANKNFLVLSGMVRDEKTKSKSGIPCLGGLPLIGAAFSKNNDLQTKNNIVIFIRPHIVNSYQEMLHLTETQEDFFREHQPTPRLEKEYDEATELIKTYENE